MRYAAVWCVGDCADEISLMGGCTIFRSGLLSDGFCGFHLYIFSLVTANSQELSADRTDMISIIKTNN